VPQHDVEAIGAEHVIAVLLEGLDVFVMRRHLFSKPASMRNCSAKYDSTAVKASSRARMAMRRRNRLASESIQAEQGRALAMVRWSRDGVQKRWPPGQPKEMAATGRRARSVEAAFSCLRVAADGHATEVAVTQRLIQRWRRTWP
jgi:hypothetical protein